ncbi:MAG: type II toxin-antitoxin system RelE/ParE family toxin [Candidatus Gastranaerophilales bacterium]|nr:type II toxin-antitoxin system RelE/ParE family toxin [Candidatus Gastranaerophilales bacterium]
MIEQIYKLEIYSTDREKEPFSEWLESLEITDRARIRVRLDRIILGNFGDHKHLDNGVYELRFMNNSGFRIYYGIDNDIVVILLNGGDKDTQDRDIEKAKNYWKDYKTRKVGV